ncbi:MAG TPA: hypothetical protein VGP47_01325 [Parachlamydiaceae bacterium]|nr:hypothetical protein [Parachlamydiaceae bacterium]
MITNNRAPWNQSKFDLNTFDSSSEFNKWIHSNGFETLVLNSELFFAAYCVKAYNASYSDIISKYSTKKIADEIEKIRLFFSEGCLSQNNFKIYLIPGDSYTYYLRGEKERSYFDVANEKSGEIYCYNKFEPVLEKLSRVCGAIFNKTYEKHQVLRERNALPHEENIPVLNFEWNSEAVRKFHVNRIKAKKYDCELYSKEDEREEIHSELLPKKLRSTTSNKQIITFCNYSTATIRAYVDSVYMEPDDFEMKYINKRFPVYELLNFAMHYDLISLKDNCIEIICHQATDEDIDEVLAACKRCESKKLNALYEKLIQS